MQELSKAKCYLQLWGPKDPVWVKLRRGKDCLKTPPSPPAPPHPAWPIFSFPDTRTHRPWIPLLPLASKPAPGKGSVLIHCTFSLHSGSSWGLSLPGKGGFALIKEGWPLAGREQEAGSLCSPDTSEVLVGQMGTAALTPQGSTGDCEGASALSADSSTPVPPHRMARHQHFLIMDVLPTPTTPIR